MSEFTFHLPGAVIHGVCETDGATDQAILSAVADDFAAGERERGTEYSVDSFVRLSYHVEPAETEAPAKPRGKTKSKAK